MRPRLERHLPFLNQERTESHWPGACVGTVIQGEADETRSASGSAGAARRLRRVHQREFHDVRARWLLAGVVGTDHDRSHDFRGDGKGVHGLPGRQGRGHVPGILNRRQDRSGHDPAVIRMDIAPA